jgi:DNA-binding transcriptional ArsR family regulator
LILQGTFEFGRTIVSELVARWRSDYLQFMSTANQLAEIGALMGDPARANMLTLLLDGQEHSASDLAAGAHVARSTASWHLASLMKGRLVVAKRSGRNRYYQLASGHIAQMLETAFVIAHAQRDRPEVRADETMRNARTCYDQLAGRLGVGLTDALVRDGSVVLSHDGGEFTARGDKVLASFGLDLDTISRKKRIYCRPCLDWTERRPHLAGAVGAAIAERCFALGWVQRVHGSRALNVSPSGKAGFARAFGIKS